MYINTSQVMGTVKYKYKTSKVKKKIMINVPILSLLYDIPPAFFLYHKGHNNQDDTPQPKGQARITALCYAYRMHEIRCHEYIISFYIAIFNRLPSYKKVSNRFKLIIKREDEALEIVFTPSFGKNKSRKRWYFRAENGQDCILLMSFSTRVKNNNK